MTNDNHHLINGLPFPKAPMRLPKKITFAEKIWFNFCSRFSYLHFCHDTFLLLVLSTMYFKQIEMQEEALWGDLFNLCRRIMRKKAIKGKWGSNKMEIRLNFQIIFPTRLFWLKISHLVTLKSGQDPHVSMVVTLVHLVILVTPATMVTLATLVLPNGGINFLSLVLLE